MSPWLIKKGVPGIRQKAQGNDQNQLTGQGNDRNEDMTFAQHLAQALLLSRQDYETAERLRFKERQQKRTKHEKTPDYARWLGVKTRDEEFTHNNVCENENDLNEAWFLKPLEFPTIVEGGGSGADIQNNEQVKNLATGKDLPQKASKRGRTESPPKADKPPTSPNPEVQEENKTDPPMDLAANEDRA